VNRRIALGLEYDGGGYSGWQRQRHARTLQAEIEAALSGVADEPVSVTAAGRTDAGVHATNQVIHFDTSAVRPERAWVRGVTTNLPPDMGVRWAREVAPDFHARYKAASRRYRYVLVSDSRRPVLLRGRVAWTWKPLAIEPMRAAAAHLIGEHDFSSFRAVACQAKHAVRCIHRLEVTQGAGFTYLDIEANAFLHHMVRNIAGSLMAVGAGERSPAWLGEVLAARDRTVAGITAPADGLYMTGVRYPAEHEVPAEGWLPLFA
jgi:tRNA pseudouridine38-40 synthase